MVDGGMGTGDGARLAAAIASWVAAGDEEGSVSAMVIMLAFGVFCVERDKILSDTWRI